MGDKIEDEDRCMLILCSSSDTWDHLVMDIGNTKTTFKMKDVVFSLLSKEAWRISFEMSKEALVVRGRSKEKGKQKDENSKSKSKERSNSPGKKSKVKY